MPIIAASVEANGWVLRLDVSGSLGSFASYVLDPDGSPRVTLASSHAGFIKSGGQAVAGNMARALVGTKPLRLPVNPASPNTPVIDETDLGGGTIRVRIALSEHIYATDTALSLAVLADWRTGEGAASGIAVANNSTCVAPIPIMRWALLPYDVTAGAFRVSLDVTSHHPVGFEPVAGVKFTATDGTNVKTVWDLTLETDNSFGDNLRCYTAIIDPTTATALMAGLLRIDAEVYPWLGTMRTTDPAGTRSMATLRTDGFSVNAQSPWVIGYDPAGTRYGQQFAFIDPVNGTATAAAGMVQPTLAAARAIAPASRPRDINTALQAGYLANRTLPAANGQAAQTRSVDGMQLVLAVGTHLGSGSTTVTTGLATAEIPVRIMGDPADGNPRANVMLQTAANSPGRVTRAFWRDLTVEHGTNVLSATTYNFNDNAIFRAKAGQEANTTAPFSTATPAGQYNLGFTRCRWWRSGVNIGSGSARVGLFRANEHSRTVNGFLIALKNRLIGNVEDGFVGMGALATIFTGWPSATLAGQAEDIVVKWNDIRFLRGRAWSPGLLPAATAGTPNPSNRRQVFMGNICERIGGDPQPFYALGEDVSATMSYNIIEGNTFVGDRSNTLYSDPLPTSIIDTNSQRNQAFVNRVANNAFDWLPTKHDDFNDPTTATLRGTANGLRPQMIEAWSMLYGVGHEGNVDTRRATAASPNNFPLEYSGARTVTGYTGAFAPLYINDQSIAGPSGALAVGGGNYRPAAASPLAGRAARGNSDVDADGLTRRIPYAAGAFQVVAVDLATAAARSPGSAGSAAVGWSAALPAASGAMTVTAADVSLAWLGSLMPTMARHDVATASSRLSVSIAVAPDGGPLPIGAGATVIGLASVMMPDPAFLPCGASESGVLAASIALLGVDGAAMAHRAARPMLLGAGARAAATLIVGPDPRRLVPTRN
jgi:hypothetical protein